MICFAEDRCKKFKEGNCNKELCGMCKLVNSAFKQSEIPKRYRKDTPLYPQDADKPAFTFLNNFKLNVMDFVENGEGLYIYSKGCGNGKTTWSTKIAKEYILKSACKQEFIDLVYFVNVADYLESLKQCFNGNKSTEEVERPLKECKLLILDDIGVEKSSEWVIERLYAVINYRVNEEKSMIITSNLTLTELSQKLNDRIASRINGSCKVVQIIGKDRRAI